MTTIIIRLKSLIIFGLVLLSISFVWLGVTGWGQFKHAFIRSEQGLETMAPDNTSGGIPANDNASAPQDNVGDQPPQVPAESPVSVAQPPVVTIVQENSGSMDNFFSEYRIDRERTRSERVEILREIVSNPNSSAQMRQEAQQKLIQISDNLDKESKIENAMIAKGFREAVAVIQPGTVMIIVPSSGLRQDEVARLSDIVVKVTGCKMEDIVIVPKSQ